MNILKRSLKRIIWRVRRPLGIDNAALLLGKLLAERNREKEKALPLSEAEFKVFSQWGEDGIIQFLIHRLKIPCKTFVEFGVEDYTEANTRFLLINDNWSGLVIDSSQANINFIKRDDVYWRHDIRAVCSFITRENICRLISDNIQEKEIGLLSIDIDGNDYWIWKAITTVKPRIVICEYNGIFGCEHFISVPYEPGFQRSKKHFSNLYWGASLPALGLLAEEKGYVFVGCNSNGNNAFFVRKDICPFPAVDYRNGFVAPKFRDSKDRNNRLTYLSGPEKIKIMHNMEVFDLKLGKNVLIKDIFG